MVKKNQYCLTAIKLNIFFVCGRWSQCWSSKDSTTTYWVWKRQNNNNKKSELFRRLQKRPWNDIYSDLMGGDEGKCTLWNQQRLQNVTKRDDSSLFEKHTWRWLLMRSQILFPESCNNRTKHLRGFYDKYWHIDSSWIAKQFFAFLLFSF